MGTAVSTETTGAPGTGSPAEQAGGAGEGAGSEQQQDQQVEQQPKGPLTKQEARQVNRDELTRAREAKERAQPKEEPKAAQEAKAGEAGTGEAAGKPAGEEQKPGEQQETKPAAQPITVTIPADHPASQGRATTFQVADQHQADTLRALAKGTYGRLSELETLRAQNRDLHERIVRMEARDAAQLKFEQTPEYQAARTEAFRLQELEEQEQVPKGTSARYWKGFLTSFEPLAEQEFNTRMAEVEAAADDESAGQWVDVAFADAADYVPEPIRNLPNYQMWFKNAVEAFNDRLVRGHYTDISRETYPRLQDRLDAMHRAFRGFFSGLISAEPEARSIFAKHRQAQTQQQQEQEAAARRQQERDEQLKREAVEEYLKGQAVRRGGVPPHPLGKVGGGVSRDRTPQGASGAEEQPDLSTMSPHDVKKTLRQQNREAVRQRMGGRP